jgi:hypothetical protein
MDTFSQPDRETRERHKLLEAEEARRELFPRIFEGKQIEQATRPDGMFQITEKGHADRHISPARKLARMRRESEMVARAQSRQETCWMPDCSAKASSHVLCVDFDLKATEHDGDTVLSTLDDPYPGAVPGFCTSCITRGPKALAEAVYNSKAQMKWGLKPLRWWVVMLDGSKIGGPCEDIDHILAPAVKDAHEPA